MTQPDKEGEEEKEAEGHMEWVAVVVFVEVRDAEIVRVEVSLPLPGGLLETVFEDVGEGVAAEGEAVPVATRDLLCAP